MAEFSREEKVEAIVGVYKYCDKLIDAIDVLAPELKDGEADFNSELLGNVMQGINWVVEILQQVMDVINEKDQKLDKEVFNQALIALDEAYKSGDPVRLGTALQESMADALEMICNVGDQFQEA